MVTAVDVKDAADVTRNVNTLPALGSAAAAASLPVAQSTEDIARAGIITETAPASDTASSGANGRLQRVAQRITSLIALIPAALGATTAAASLSTTTATDDPLLAGIATPTTDVTGPATGTAHIAGDAISNSTSAPTAGGFTFTSAARASGKSGLITDLFVASSNAAGGLSGELWIFDTAVTAINDDAAFAISDAEMKTVVAVIPFTTIADTNNSQAHCQALSIGFTTAGSANLRFLVKAKAAYTMANSEVLTFRLKCLQA